MKYYVFTWDWHGMSVEEMKEDIKKYSDLEVYDNLDEAIASLEHQGDFDLADDEGGCVFDGEEIVYVLV